VTPPTTEIARSSDVAAIDFSARLGHIPDEKET
jgi:hypothetical protein